MPSTTGSPSARAAAAARVAAKTARATHKDRIPIDESQKDFHSVAQPPVVVLQGGSTYKAARSNVGVSIVDAMLVDTVPPGHQHPALARRNSKP